MNREQFLCRYQLLSPDRPESATAAVISDTATHTAAAVLIPLLDAGAGEPLELLLTRRSAHLRHHPGQISFPGGRHESHDRDLLATALRESHEEIGLATSQVEIIGSMPALPTLTGFTIAPWLGLVPADTPLQRDHNEVAELLRLPLSYLLCQDNWQQYHFHRGGRRHTTWFIRYQQHLVWGATATLLQRLSKHIGP